MKKYFRYIISIIVSINFVVAQVNEGTVEFNMGPHNALQVNLVDVDKKLVEVAWKKYTNQFGKPDKKKGEYITENVVMNGLTNPVDWFMKLDKNKKDILLQLCVISNDEFLSSSSQSSNYRVLEKYIKDFAYVVEKTKVTEEYEAEAKTLEKLQKKLKKLVSDYNSNVKSIEKNNKKINKAEKNKKSNLKEQSAVKGEIAQQGLVVEDIISKSSQAISEGNVSPEYEEANKDLLKLRKKLDKLVKNYDDDVKSVEKSIKKINKAEKDNKSNAKDQSKTKGKLSDQGKVVERLRKTLNSM